LPKLLLLFLIPFCVLSLRFWDCWTFDYTVEHFYSWKTCTKTIGGPNYIKQRTPDSGPSKLSIVLKTNIRIPCIQSEVSKNQQNKNMSLYENFVIKDFYSENFEKFAMYIPYLKHFSPDCNIWRMFLITSTSCAWGWEIYIENLIQK